MSTYHFDPVDHVYTSHGKRLFSVSSVVNCIETGKFDYINPARLRHAAERGTLVHRLCEVWDRDQILDPAITDETAPFLLAWTRFCEDYRPKWDGIEEQIFNDSIGLAGTLDRAGSWRGVDLGILDIKTPIQDCPLWRLQTAGYKVLKANLNPQYATARRFTVQLRPTGTYQIEEHTNSADIDVFKAQLNVLNYLKNNGMIA